MSKVTLIVIIILSLTNFVFANPTNDEAAVEKVSMMYLDGFYQGDTAKLKKCLDPELNKFGYWKDKDADSFGDKIPMTFEAALKFAQNVKDKKQFPDKDAPKEVEVIDVLDKIAISKVTGWWGVDFMLLAKNDGKWMIRQIIWEGPVKIATPTATDKEAVKNVGLRYIEGFYEGDTSKLSISLKADMYKFGYGFDRKAGKYRVGGQMTFDEALALAKRFKDTNKLAKPNAIKKVEVLEVRNKIAAVKITAWWGVDYMLLSKNGDKWMIEQILWASQPPK